MSTILFGGSFDPVHLGHIQTAEFALNAAAAKRVLFIPSAKPFFGKQGYSASARDRLAMLEIALAPYPWAHICLYEIQNSLTEQSADVRYTIDTLHFLQKHYLVESQPYLLIGDDLAESFYTWKNYRELAEQTKILIAVRESRLEKTPDFPHILLKNAPLEYASSYIRNCIASGKNYRKFVPKEVYRYIEHEKLYRSF